MTATGRWLLSDEGTIPILHKTCHYSKSDIKPNKVLQLFALVDSSISEGPSTALYARLSRPNKDSSSRFLLECHFYNNSLEVFPEEAVLLPQHNPVLSWAMLWLLRIWQLNQLQSSIAIAAIISKLFLNSWGPGWGCIVLPMMSPAVPLSILRYWLLQRKSGVSSYSNIVSFLPTGGPLGCSEYLFFPSGLPFPKLRTSAAARCTVCCSLPLKLRHLRFTLLATTSPELACWFPFCRDNPQKCLRLDVEPLLLPPLVLPCQLLVLVLLDGFQLTPYLSLFISDFYWIQFWNLISNF